MKKGEDFFNLHLRRSQSQSEQCIWVLFFLRILVCFFKSNLIQWEFFTKEMLNIVVGHIFKVSVIFVVIEKFSKNIGHINSILSMKYFFLIVIISYSITGIEFFNDTTIITLVLYFKNLNIVSVWKIEKSIWFLFDIRYDFFLNKKYFMETILGRIYCIWFSCVYFTIFINFTIQKFSFITKSF